MSNKGALNRWLDKIWYQNHPSKWLLLPLNILFIVLSSIRRWFYKVGVLKSFHPGVPVIVIGNISVGGNGKTPTVLAVVKWLHEAGFRPGIISRGYGGRCDNHPHLVTVDDSASWVGDEPLLMASRRHAPVVIDPIRARGASLLVDKGCNVIVCDDGLQHYALQRDIEWVVMDDRGVGNGARLPMGPLREPLSRLNRVACVVHNGTKPIWPSAQTFSLRPTQCINLKSGKEVSIDSFKLTYKAGINAMAGIGHPARFFDMLLKLGFNLKQQLAFVDHHAYTADDVPQSAVLMTEKDAVKCKAFAHTQCWYMPVESVFSEKTKSALLSQIRSASLRMNKTTSSEKSHGI